MFLTETEADGATSPFGILRPVSWAGAIGGLGEFLGDLPGAGPLRVPISEAPSPDHDHLRVWEIAGGAHGDQAFLAYAVAELTKDLLAPLQASLYVQVPVACVLPLNEFTEGRPFSAALHQLNDWVDTGELPPSHTSEERRVGKECVHTCRYGGSPAQSQT